ncbi:hypothetical protein BHT10_18835 [Burkholderia pseudomallei]|nr:hypothetical protein BHT10_18835 [Burkholderia pseudomallei]
MDDDRARAWATPGIVGTPKVAGYAVDTSATAARSDAPGCARMCPDVPGCARMCPRRAVCARAGHGLAVPAALRSARRIRSCSNVGHASRDARGPRHGRDRP